MVLINWKTWTHILLATDQAPYPFGYPATRSCDLVILCCSLLHGPLVDLACFVIVAWLTSVVYVNYSWIRLFVDVHTPARVLRQWSDHSCPAAVGVGRWSGCGHLPWQHQPSRCLLQRPGPCRQGAYWPWCLHQSGQQYWTGRLFVYLMQWISTRFK